MVAPEALHTQSSKDRQAPEAGGAGVGGAPCGGGMLSFLTARVTLGKGTLHNLQAVTSFEV